MPDEDCYFFIDPSVPYKDRKLSVLCVQCHNDQMPDTGMFYLGSQEGYGPFDFKCCICGKYIHKTGEDSE